MRLWVLSDLHCEHGGGHPSPPASADIAVVAGDVCGDQYLGRLASQLPVVFVGGNHEFYRHAIPDRKRQIAAIPRLTFLDDSSAVVEGVIFIGATLWTDYGMDPVAAEAARRGMNDHRLIAWSKNPWQRFLPSHATQLHQASRKYIEAELKHDATAPVVVVTHHAPSRRSIDPRYETGPYAALNRAYYSDMDDVVEKSGAALWVHGHVHTPFDYMIGNTRVLCNPRGYPHEAGNGFNPNLIVEV